MMLIAQITDTHIQRPGTLTYDIVDTAAMLRDCVTQILRLDPQPDLILLTGDLTDLGQAEEYAHLRQLLKPLRQKIIVIPGNHDDRATLRAAWHDADYLPATGFLHFVLEDYPLRLIGLDTVIPGEGGGELCDERLAWLTARLAARPQAPTVILMHHPPFITGIDHMDALGLRGREAFAGIMRQNPQVELVLCGHLHRTIHAQIGGRAVLTCPSTAHQVELGLAPDAPSNFIMEPPGFMLHRWQDGQMVSHLAAIGNYAGPYLFP
jgi:3',5'-cyclic AMP phosphodiesterase CpdA